MRELIIDCGPNSGRVVKLDQDYLFRGTSHKKFMERIAGRDYYCGSEDDEYGLSTFVATNIDGAVSYCWYPPYRKSFYSSDDRDKDVVVYDESSLVAIHDDGIGYIDEEGAYRFVRNRPLLLAIAHGKYPLRSPLDEGLVIPGRISLTDIVLVKSEKDLSNVLPPDNNLGDKAIQRVKLFAGIF